jgi:hypothetical protein
MRERGVPGLLFVDGRGGRGLVHLLIGEDARPGQRAGQRAGTGRHRGIIGPRQVEDDKGNII